MDSLDNSVLRISRLFYRGESYLRVGSWPEAYLLFKKTVELCKELDPKDDELVKLESRATAQSYYAHASSILEAEGEQSLVSDTSEITVMTFDS
jgi:hypothetical protein